MHACRGTAPGVGSIALIAIASAWFVERALDVKRMTQAQRVPCPDYAG
jgi:hypothetical protein